MKSNSSLQNCLISMGPISNNFKKFRTWLNAILVIIRKRILKYILLGHMNIKCFILCSQVKDSLYKIRYQCQQRFFVVPLGFYLCSTSFNSKTQEIRLVLDSLAMLALSSTSHKNHRWKQLLGFKWEYWYLGITQGSTAGRVPRKEYELSMQMRDTTRQDSETQKDTWVFHLSWWCLVRS